MELEWFSNYLTDRKQFVFVDGKCSPLLDILLGVPQGSILGPLLFLLYINDLPRASALLSSLFADDTTLLSSGPDINRLASFVNTEFQKVVQFFREHKLALHPKKTNFLLFTSSNAVRETPPSIYINNNDIGAPLDPLKLFSVPNVNSNSSTPAVKFLGIHIDPLLNFKFHIDSISKKLSTALFFLRNAKHFLTFRAMKSLYYSLFHSNVIFGIQVWSSTPQSNLKDLTLKQKMAVRTIHNAKYNDHTEPLFKSARILPLEQLIDFFTLQFMQHYLQGFLPISFNNTWTLNVARRHENFQLQLRNDEEIDIPFARLSLTDRQPLSRIPRTWLEFQNENIKIIRNKCTFNKDLKEHFLSKLNGNFKCERLLCLQCHPPDRL